MSTMEFYTLQELLGRWLLKTCKPSIILTLTQLLISTLLFYGSTVLGAFIFLIWEINTTKIGSFLLCILASLALKFYLHS